MQLARQSKSGIMSDKADMSEKIKSDKARLDRTHKSGGASDGGVAQLVRAAES